MSDHIVITAVGARTPVGANAEQSSAAIAAGIVRVNEHAYYECIPEDPEWDPPLPLYVSDVPLIDPFTDGTDRLYELALPAITEIFGKARLKRQAVERCGLMLALPELDPAINALRLPERFIPELCQRIGVSTFALWKTTQAGRNGVFSLLESAVAKLTAGDIDMCIVGGVDSYLMEHRLSYFDNAWRLRSARTVDGFIPGEAAALLLLETAQHAQRRGARVLARLGELGEGNEAETLASPKRSTGEGLATAIRAVLTNTPEIDSVYCSLNGESYFALEWGTVLARLHNPLQTLKDLIHPADCVGDVGSATGALLLTCASLKKPSPNAVPSLLWTAGDDPHRIALTLYHHNT